jgi:hypothetical protein
MPIYPDADARNADWTKGNVLDLPGQMSAAGVAEYLVGQGKTWEQFRRLPSFDRWAVIYPWLSDVPAELAKLAPTYTAGQ